MEKISDAEIQNEFLDKNESSDSQEHQVITKVGWIGEPAVTLVTKTICPLCKAENSFVLKEMLPTSPAMYRYICSKCGTVLEVKQPFSSIVYVDKKSYEEQVKKSGTTTVRGVYE